MRELRSRVIINKWIELMMLWYDNIFCECRKLGGEDRKHSNWREVIFSKRQCSKRPILASESVWHLLFHVGIFYSGVLYLSPHICIFYSVFVGLSLYHLFVRYIISFIHSSKKWRRGGNILENNLLLNKEYFGSVYINPNYPPPPLC